METSGSIPSASEVNPFPLVQVPVVKLTCTFDLLAGIANGHPLAALTDLYDIAAPRALRYAQALLRNQHDAEEALQATFVQVALNVSLLASANSPWAYFLRMLRNEAFKMLRKQPPTTSLDLWDGAIATEVTSEMEVEQKLLVQRALQALPATQSEVIVLKIWEEMTFQEIAEVLNQSAHTVASRYRYGLKKLEQMLQRHFEEFSFPLDTTL